MVKLINKCRIKFSNAKDLTIWHDSYKIKEVQALISNSFPSNLNKFCFESSENFESKELSCLKELKTTNAYVQLTGFNFQTYENFADSIRYFSKAYTLEFNNSKFNNLVCKSFTKLEGISIKNIKIGDLGSFAEDNFKLMIIDSGVAQCVKSIDILIMDDDTKRKVKIIAEVWINKFTI